MALIGFELRRIVGRRGSFFGVMAVCFGFALLAAFLVPSGEQNAGVWITAIGTPLVFGGAVVAALEGSYDQAQGTMRYLVLTGVPRWRLVVNRVPALLLALLLIALPAMVVGAVSMVGDDQPTNEIVIGLAAGLTYGAIWGIVAMAVGTLLRSNGAGIAVALVLYLLSTAITAFVEAQVSETVAEYLLPNVAAVVAAFGYTGDDDFTSTNAIPYATAVVVLLVWLVAIVALAIARVQRDEY
ncbi:MAG: hypothetical protein PGN13_14805 [Patulibacter minatonensis]